MPLEKKKRGKYKIGERESEGRIVIKKFLISFIVYYRTYYSNDIYYKIVEHNFRLTRAFQLVQLIKFFVVK